MACPNCTPLVQFIIEPAPAEPEYPDVEIFGGAVAVQFDERSPYLVLTPDGAVSERFTLGGVA